MFTQQQIENELNTRNYWKESIDQAPGGEPPEIPPFIPEIPPYLPEQPHPTSPPVTPPSTLPPSIDAGLIDRFGSLALVGIGVLFLLAIFPGQSDDLVQNESGGAI